MQNALAIVFLFVSKHLTDIIIVKECFELQNTLANSPSIGAEMQLSKHIIVNMLVTKNVSEKNWKKWRNKRGSAH